MEELSKEVFDYIKNNNGVYDNLFNAWFVEMLRDCISISKENY